MEEKLAKLVYDYIKEGRNLDMDFISKVTEIAVDSRDLGDYVLQEMFINAPESNSVAVYLPDTKKIIFNIAGVNRAEELADFYSDLFEQEENVVSFNLTIAQWILHEVEHAWQEKVFRTAGDQSFEHELIVACLDAKRWHKKNAKRGLTEEEIKQRRAELMREYYMFDPLERLAEIKSHEVIIKVVELLKEHYPTLYDVEQTKYLEKLVDKHPETIKERSCPTEVYLKGVECYDRWKSFDFYSKKRGELIENVTNKYDKLSRLRYGLPISRSEYLDESIKLIKSKKYNYIFNKAGVRL